jgi:PAS domain S-box-containing protein
MSQETPYDTPAQGTVGDPQSSITSDMLIGHLHAGLAVVDLDGRFEFLSAGFERISGWSVQDLYGRGIMKIIPANLHRFMLDQWDAASKDSTICCYDMQITHKQGHIVPVMITQQTIPKGEADSRILLLMQDLVSSCTNQREQEQYREHLERKVQERTAALVQTNQRLLRSETALERAQTSALIGSWEWQKGWERTEWSRQLFILHGLSPESLPPTPEEFFNFIHPDDREHVRHAFERAVRDQVGFEREYRLVRPDGSVIDVLGRGQFYPTPPGRPLHMYGTVQEITERRRLERQIVEASQNEQQRIGRDLHDTLGQELTGLSLLAKALERQISKIAPDQATTAAEISRIAALSASHARDIAHGLSPVEISQEGLSTELQRMSERVTKLYNINCVFTPHGNDLVHDNAAATHLYHIAQEAVTNSVKHARPSCVRVDLWGGHPGKLVISNDHDGTTPPRIPGTESKGSGLRIMRHRADIIKAELSIAHTSKGSQVICKFPNRPATAATVRP